MLEREKQQEGKVPSSHISNRSPSLIRSQPPMSVHVERHPRSSRPKTRSRPIQALLRHQRERSGPDPQSALLPAHKGLWSPVPYNALVERDVFESDKRAVIYLDLIGFAVRSSIGL